MDAFRKAVEAARKQIPTSSPSAALFDSLLLDILNRIDHEQTYPASGSKEEAVAQAKAALDAAQEG